MRILLVTFLFLGLAQSASAEDLSSLIAQAQEQRLAQDPQWLALLHFDETFPRGRLQSRSQSPEFFFAKFGPTDAEAELEATLRAYLESEKQGDDPPICRFPARYEWLTSQLPSLRKLSPKPTCKRLNDWYAALDPAVVTMIFPASFLNNPASAFGHTFIRLDQAKQTEETRLLAYAADYAALTHGEGALAYAAKGIFGGYNGFYSVAPFPKKVTKYSDLENRDIWEYALELTPAEVKLLTLHLWELRDIPFSYYYFDENCSYHILALLQVARPSLKLVQAFKTWVLPVDTIRELLTHDGIVQKTVFRPSAASKLRQRIAATSPEAQNVALRLVEQPKQSVAQNISGLEISKQAEALDLAYDFQTYQRIKRRDDSDESKRQAWELLTARSKLPPTPALPVPVPAVRPEQGHKTGLVSLAAGQSDGRWISELQVRPALHALSDPPPGYLPGSQIKFFDTLLRYTDTGNFSLQRVTAIDIFSLTPRDKFFHPLSWRVNLEGRRLQSDEKSNPFIASLSGGGGRSYQLSESVLGYGLIDAELQASNSFQDHYALGVGPHFGLIFTPNDWIGTELSVLAYKYPWGDSHNVLRASVSQRFSLSTNYALRFEAANEREFNQSSWLGILRLEAFFSP